MYQNIASGGIEKKESERIVGALGLARKAGKLIIGGELCEECIRGGKAELAFLCSDMSENSQKKLHAALRTGNVPYIILPLTKSELAVRFGKKSFAVACVLTDRGFARIVYKALGISESQDLHDSK